MKYIYIILSSIPLLFFSCKKKVEFVVLPNHCGKSNYSSEEYNNKTFVYQSILVKNFSKKDSKILFRYHKNKIDSIFKDKNTITYFTTFYQDNSSISYFLNHKDDPGGFSSEILSDYYKEYGIAEIETSRIGNSNKLINKISYPNKNESEIIK